jgi:1-acyl-sn-glycerol-3-phosphate acyltransferase
MTEIDAAAEVRNTPLLWRLSAWIGRPLARLLVGLDVRGLECVPLEGPVIIASNHLSLLDGPILTLALSRRRFLRQLGKVELFSIPILGWYLRQTGQIPINRKGDVSSMRTAMDFLERGTCLGISPEGTRSKTGQPGRPKPGVAFLAGRARVRVVPARISGTESFPPKRPVRVVFGQALSFSGDPGDRTQCQNFANQVMNGIINL